MQPNILKTLARGAGVAFLQLSSVGLVYIVQIFLARWMETIEYGIYEYVVSWTLLLAILAELGLPTVVLRLIAEYKVRSQRRLLVYDALSSWHQVFLPGGDGGRQPEIELTSATAV